MRKIFVTGATGFVGGHLVRALRSRGFPIRCLVRPTSNLAFIKTADPELVIGDVSDPSTLEAALGDADAVVHCAGLTRAGSRREYFRVNEGGTQNLLAACAKRKARIRSIVHISSLAAIGPSIDGLPVTEETEPHPVSDYGSSKLAAQRAAESLKSDLPICVIVPPAVYGPCDSDFLIYFKLVSRGLMPQIGPADRRLSLLYAEDLAGAVVSALTNGRAAGRTYLVEDGAIHSWTSVGETIARAMNRSVRRLRIPAPVVKGIGALADFGSKITGRAWLINSQKVEDFTQTAWTCSSRRIREELAYQPLNSLEEGIRKTLAWYRENRWL